jgi:hypothetical protein
MTRPAPTRGLVYTTSTFSESTIAGKDTGFIPKSKNRSNQADRDELRLGDIGPISEKPIQHSLTVRKDRDNYFHIAIYSQYVLLTELLVVSWNNGRWNADWSLIHTGDNQWIHQVADDFPYVERAK